MTDLSDHFASRATTDRRIPVFPAHALPFAPVRRRVVLTEAERELCRAVVATADRINLEQPRLPVFACQLPPPMDGSPDRKPIGWSLASIAMILLFVLLSFQAVRK